MTHHYGQGRLLLTSGSVIVEGSPWSVIAEISVVKTLSSLRH